MKLERSLVVNGLVLAVAVGSGVALFVTRERPTTEQREARPNNLCAEFARDRLRFVQIRSASQDFKLERHALDAGSAEYTLSVGGAADTEAAESLLRALEIASFVRRFDAAKVDRTAFGLDAPRAEINVDFGGSTLTLRIGNPAATPSGTSYVEAISGLRPASIGLVRASTLKDLLISSDALRSRTLLPFAVPELVAVDFEDKGVHVAVRRGKGPAWLNERGERVFRDAIERLGFELTALKAEHFLPVADANRLLAGGDVLRARFKLKSGPDVEIRVGASCPDDPSLSVLARGPDASAACVGRGLRDLFATTAKNLDDLQLFSLHMDEAESLLIERAGKKLELMRTERGFRLLSPALSDVELDIGNRRLQAVIGASGEASTSGDAAALGLTLPSGRVRLRSTTVPGTERFDEVIEIGRAGADGRLPVRRAEDGRVLLLDRDAARALEVDTTLLRNPKLFDFGPSELSELEISWGKEHERLRRSNGSSFEFVQPQADLDGALSLELIQALGTLKVERWVADADDGSFGLARPRARASLKLSPRDGGSSTATLLIGAETRGGAYAALEGAAGVFVLEKAFVEKLCTLLLTRAAFSAEASAIERLDIEGRGRTLGLVRRGNDLVPTSGTALPGEMLPRLLEAISNLRPEAAIHTGAELPEEGLDSPILRVNVKLRAGLGGRKSFRIGKADTFHDGKVFYARADGIDATYAIPHGAVRDLLEAL